jgi:hypothetical protein
MTEGAAVKVLLVEDNLDLASAPCWPTAREKSALSG